jgi:Cd2+/Zn2+-exporting ATPase
LQRLLQFLRHAFECHNVLLYEKIEQALADCNPPTTKIYAWIANIYSVQTLPHIVQILKPSFQPVSKEPTPNDPTLASPEGLLEIHADPSHARVEVEFNPQKLTDHEVRDLIHRHIESLESSIRKQTYRLENTGCEACALKLERRVARIPGVRRATATYLGHVLHVVFDPVDDDDTALESSLRKAGAKISPLPLGPSQASGHILTRLRSGDWNEEISCTLGFLFLIAAAIIEKTSGSGTTSHILYAGAYLFAGQQGVRSAIASLREKVLDVDVLMVLAALGAAAIGAPFEGALLLFLFSLSNVLQSHAMNRTQRAIESLLSLRPSEALVKRNGVATTVPVEDIAIGETVLIRPGGQIPVDGVVAQGETHIDEASITGESMPVAKQPGSKLFAGTINQGGGIEMYCVRPSGDSTIARMVKLVAEAQAEKSKTQRFLERAEQAYALGVILFTIGVWLVPWLLFDWPFQQAFYKAMTVMVVASPCALIISTPATVLSAIGGAARRGILIKGGSHLEQAARIEILAVDKTGTLTVGKPSLTHIVTINGASIATDSLPSETSHLLAIAAGLEAMSEHPLAHAISQSAREHTLPVPVAHGFQATAGKGAEAIVEGAPWIIGSERMLTEREAMGISELREKATQWIEGGHTCVWMAQRDGERIFALAVFVMADTLRPEAKQLIQNVHLQGVRKVVMLTGDQPAVAQAIGRQAGIDEIHASLLPEDKLRIIRELRREGPVMMVGDGVNDAPALAMADLGVAMGAAGTDVAMETADIVLMGDRLENIPLLLAHARRARRILIQNLVFACTVILVLVIAALGFSLPLPLGVVGHEGSTVLVCLNGLRLLMLRE